jgi:deoxyribonuclease-1
VSGPNKKFESFTGVKNLLLTEVYADHRITFYCGCEFTKDKKVRCNVGEGRRAKSIEWDHVVPASFFGRNFAEWKEDNSWQCKMYPWVQKLFVLKCREYGRRENARRVSKEYRLMESDMYNLVPAIGFINQRRSDKPFDIIPGERRNFGDCDFEVEYGKVEPAPHIRGDIARIYLYMADTYPGRVRLPEKEKQMFESWAAEDPVDEWECRRCKRIEKLQGNANERVRTPCKSAGLW